MKKPTSIKIINPFKNKKFKHGGLSILLTVIFIAGIVMINIIAGMLLERFNVKVDLTENRLYTIEEATTNYLNQLDDKVSIIVMSRETEFTGRSMYNNQANEIIKRFAAASPNVTVRYIDLMSNPTFANNYSNLTPASIIVESENTGRHKILTNEDYVARSYFGMDGSQISFDEYRMLMSYGMGHMTFVDYSAATESALLSAFLSVTDIEPVYVGICIGFGESPLTSAYKLLDRNAYILQTVDLMTEEIDPELDFLIINVPQTDYSDVAIQKIDKWLDNNGEFGKNLIYIAPYILETPKLDLFLQDWGIEVEQALVWQNDNRYTSPVGSMRETITHYVAAHPEYSKGLNPSYRIYGEYLRHTKLLFEVNANILTTPLIITYDGSSVLTFEELGDEDFDIYAPREEGIYNVAVESTKTRYSATGWDVFESKVIVFGGEYLLRDDFMQMQNANNAEFFLNMMNYISGKDIDIKLTEKSFSIASFAINAEQSNVIGFIFAIALPVVIIGAGVAIWLKRRYR
ncbi:MAG: GldG family protein [Oscillospiraceae bacterium]|nr:GldG family protein [Oscillospiraceae bacterium]